MSLHSGGLSWVVVEVIVVEVEIKVRGVHAQFLATHARTLQFPGKISAHARNTHANSHTHLSMHAICTKSCDPEDSKKVRHVAVA